MLEIFNHIVKEGEATAQVAQQAGAGGIVSMLIPFGLMFVVFYFLLIRPQNKQRKKHDEMLKALKKGDVVYTTSGIVGTIFSVEERVYLLEIAEKTKIKILKSQIAGKYE